MTLRAAATPSISRSEREGLVQIYIRPFESQDAGEWEETPFGEIVVTQDLTLDGVWSYPTATIPSKSSDVVSIVFAHANAVLLAAAYMTALTETNPPNTKPEPIRCNCGADEAEEHKPNCAWVIRQHELYDQQRDS